MFSKSPDQGLRLHRLQELVPKGRRKPKPRTTRKVFRRLEAREVSHLIEAYAAGASQRQLARDFKIHPQTVTATLDRMGVVRRDHGLHGDRLERARHLYRRGKSLRIVGEELKVDAETVRRYLLADGETLRPRPGWSS